MTMDLWTISGYISIGILTAIHMWDEYGTTVPLFIGTVLLWPLILLSFSIKKIVRK